MSHEGTWNIDVKSPMGAQAGTLDLRTENDALAGTMKGPQGEMEFDGGTIDGGSLAWNIEVTTPMAITLEFAVTIDGDDLAGTVKFGAMGQGELSGTRA